MEPTISTTRFTSTKVKAIERETLNPKDRRAGDRLDMHGREQDRKIRGDDLELDHLLLALRRELRDALRVDVDVGQPRHVDVMLVENPRQILQFAQ